LSSSSNISFTSAQDSEGAVESPSSRLPSVTFGKYSAVNRTCQFELRFNKGRKGVYWMQKILQTREVNYLTWLMIKIEKDLEEQ
jgi:hypothetical protein